MYSKPEIPHKGRSPDSVPRFLPFPVSSGSSFLRQDLAGECKIAPHHSDCIVPDSHRIPFSPLPKERHLCAAFTFISDLWIIPRCRGFVNEYPLFKKNPCKKKCLPGCVPVSISACQKSPQYPRHSEPVPQHWCGNPPDERRNNWFRNKNV